MDQTGGKSGAQYLHLATVAVRNSSESFGLGCEKSPFTDTICTIFTGPMLRVMIFMDIHITSPCYALCEYTVVNSTVYQG